MNNVNWTETEKTFISMYEEFFKVKFEQDIELKNLDKWSSLSHILFLNKLEDEFGIDFEALDAVQTTTSTHLIDKVKEKCQQ